MEPTDITVEILKQIRDEVRGNGTRIDDNTSRIERIETRMVASEVRLATEIGAVVDAIHEVRDVLLEDRVLRHTVADHERRISQLERREG
jgi:hypothetical protein